MTGSKGLTLPPVTGIFIRHGDAFTPMAETPYEAESLLQELLAEHPEVLASEGSAEGAAALLLVKREAGVADDPGIGARWSLDHLFLDAEAVPTLVEVKRSSDTRIRREVVAQMLDYAANAAGYWTPDLLREWFEAECRTAGREPREVLSDSFPSVSDEDSYWRSVGVNLASGRLRLVFVSDAIPRELRRIIEFLNDQMTRTSVLGIEVKQYIDPAGLMQTIVPTILGDTESARRTKGQSGTGSWDRDSLISQVEERNGVDQAAAAVRIIDWALARQDLKPYYGRGLHDGSFTAGHPDPDRLFPFVLYGYGRVEIQFEHIRKRPPFDDVGLRGELRDRLNNIPGVDLPIEAIEKRPSLQLEVFTAQAALDGLLDVLDWVFQQSHSG
jgi:hypothetical protein